MSGELHGAALNQAKAIADGAIIGGGRINSALHKMRNICLEIADKHEWVFEEARVFNGVDYWFEGRFIWRGQIDESVIYRQKGETPEQALARLALAALEAAEK